MSEEILVNIAPNETRVALLDNGVLQEVHIERDHSRGLVGNIYKGRVQRVLPGMQAAFVNIGLERTAFLHASDVMTYDDDNHTLGQNLQQHEDISRLLVEGQDILVQVVKDPLGSKGARLTTQLTIASRYLVCMPNNPHIGVSQRIDDENERERLKDIISQHVSQALETKKLGFIVRTAADGASESELVADVTFLGKLWERIRARSLCIPSGQIVYEDLSLVYRIMRDLVNTQVEKIHIDSLDMCKALRTFASEFVPAMRDGIEHYVSERPIFDRYGVEDDIRKALGRKVQLKSGGYLIIDQTEAMTTIDVNTGAYVGHRNLEETIFKNNLEAATALARQARLRNLGGIIIIDFIDMLDEEHKRRVIRTLEKALEKDPVKTYISSVSPLGLVEMTRKRTRESLQHMLCEPCDVCHGRGFIKTAETVCYEIFREIVRVSKTYDTKAFLILAAANVVDRLLDDESSQVAELEAVTNKALSFRAESVYAQEQFDVVPM